MSSSSGEKEFKPVTVNKPIPNTYDLGNLATFDPNPLDNSILTSNNEKKKKIILHQQLEIMYNY